jgi:antitoxin CptB
MDAKVARLRWRCRRGMRELDALLSGFVDRHGAGFTDAEMAAFEGVLELPDPVLHSYLLGRSAPADPATADLIGRIRASAGPES